MHNWIKAVGFGKKRSRHLSYEEAAKAAQEIIAGTATDAQVSAFLMAVRMKGEHVEELSGWADVFRGSIEGYPLEVESINCAGVYEGRSITPVNVPVSLILASAGIPHVLQGGHHLRPQSGVCLKALLQGLGIRTDIDKAAWGELFRELHIGFFLTEQECTALRRLSSLREQIGLRTMLNTVERVLNPLHSHTMIIGIEERKAMDNLMQVLQRVGFQKSYIVQGIEGSEDVPLHKKSVVRIVNGTGDDLIIEPSAFGFKSVELHAADREQQVRDILRVLEGEKLVELRALREHVVFNAGLRMYWLDKVDSYEDGFEIARGLLDQGAGMRTLQRWRQLSMEAVGSEEPADWLVEPHPSAADQDFMQL